MKLKKNHNLTHDNYYQDTDYVSNSILNHLSGRSPEYCRFMMDNQQPATPDMNILQPEEFNNRYSVSPKFDKRTKQGKEDYAEFIKNNMFKTVISEQEYNLIELMSAKIMRDSDSKTLLSKGEKEHIIAWNNEEYDINCKGMLDVYRKDVGIIVDLKTTQDSSYNAFSSSVRKFKYYKQAAYYLDAVRASEFFIVAIEKNPPFAINIIQIGDDLLDKGREMYNRELEIYKYCTDNNYWPGEGFDYLDKNSERTIHIMNEDIL